MSECGRAFIQLSNLQQHLRNHDAQLERAKNRPFQCAICGKGFATESSLRTHTAKVHHILLFFFLLFSPKGMKKIRKVKTGRIDFFFLLLSLFVFFNSLPLDDVDEKRKKSSRRWRRRRVELSWERTEREKKLCLCLSLLFELLLPPPPLHSIPLLSLSLSLLIIEKEKKIIIIQGGWKRWKNNTQHKRKESRRVEVEKRRRVFFFFFLLLLFLFPSFYPSLHISFRYIVARKRKEGKRTSISDWAPRARINQWRFGVRKHRNALSASCSPPFPSPLLFASLLLINKIIKLITK